ncbi:MAG TPA: peptidase inhibitor family I36 protein [Vicinamibacterales bacterium]|nr:peptidase inhibitor family I36 protein [Vicinamibacterales bacterium]
MTATALGAMALLAAAVPAHAQRWGQGDRPRDGVCFYEDTNFRGDYFCVGAGESVASLPRGMNDRISSIRIFGRAEATVFRDVRFDGKSSRFGFDVSDLRREGWNDTISSIRVRSTFDDRGPSRDVDRDRDRDRGRRMSPGDADAIVRRSYRDLLGRDPDSAGMRQYRGRLLDDGWSEEDVRADIRKSPEFREKSVMTPEKARAIVRAAYLAVLKREPDAAGSAPYVERVIRDHWSQQDVERELRNSPEYRRK